MKRFTALQIPKEMQCPMAQPLYYIDYSLAAMGALEFYIRSLDNREAAWADYNKLCTLGGSKGYKELLQNANLNNPFEEGTVENIMKVLKQRVL